MKILLLIILMGSLGYAAGPKYNFKEPQLNDEMQNVYKDINNTLKGNVRISSVTISSLTVNSLNMNGHKITNLGNGTVSTDAVALGQIHYLSTPVQALVTTSSTTAGNTFISSNLTATITPTSASSKVKVTAVFTAKLSAGNADAGRFTIFRGTTNLGPSAGMVTMQVTSAVNQLIPCTLAIIDSPATTSATTYTVKFSNVNAVATVGVGSDFSSDQETIILEEVL